MPSYIIPTGTQTIVLPSGLAAVITYVDAHAGSAVTLASSGIPDITLSDGVNDNLELTYYHDIKVTVITGTYANIMVKYIGDQRSYRQFDHNIRPNSAGWYPGAWGTGDGCKSRGSMDDHMLSGYLDYDNM